MSYNLEIVQGSDYTRTFTVLDTSNNVINLTGGFSFASQLRKNPTITDYVSFTVTISDAVHGKVQIFLPHATTTTLNGKYEYDIFLTDPLGKKFRVADGLITIIPNITR